MRNKKKIAPLNLFQWLDAIPIFPKVYWRSKGEEVEIAAVGKIIEFDQPPTDHPGRFFGGRAFSKPQGIWKGFPESIFFLPAYEFVQTKDETIRYSYSSDFPPLSIQPTTNPFSVLSRKDLPDYKEWEKLVADFLNNKTLKKAVLARQSTFKLSNPPAPFHLLSQLAQKNATVFGLQISEDQAFIGATPEKLYQRKGRRVFSEAIAGTRPITASSEELLNSEKDKREFQYVKDYIRQALSPLCRSLAEGENKLLTTSTVQHLHCQFQGELKESTTDMQLLDVLHPTPAVNGTPKELAYAYLNKVEPFNRGWYASALGFISEDEADFAVGIRSALIVGSNIHLYAGGGLVEGSVAADEWEEREHKIALFKKVLS